jgi:hypothetical protein
MHAYSEFCLFILEGGSHGVGLRDWRTHHSLVGPFSPDLILLLISFRAATGLTSSRPQCYWNLSQDQKVLVLVRTRDIHE